MQIEAHSSAKSVLEALKELTVHWKKNFKLQKNRGKTATKVASKSKEQVLRVALCKG